MTDGTQLSERMELHLHVRVHLNGRQPAFSNESATVCGDDRLADGKTEAHASTFVVKNASEILLRLEIRI
jgi:hypothetical protein